MLTAQPTPYQRIFEHAGYDKAATAATLQEYRSEVEFHGANTPTAIRLRNRVVQSHVKAAAKIARRFHAPGMEPDDWLGYAVLGLVRAVELYDVDRGVTFITYATHWVRHALSIALDRCGQVVRVPNSARRAARQGHGIPLDELELLRHVASLDACEPGEAPMAERLAGAHLDPAESLDRHRMCLAAGHAVQTLPGKMREVMVRHAIGCSDGDIGASLGCSHQNVQRIRQAATARARRAYAAAMHPTQQRRPVGPLGW